MRNTLKKTPMKEVGGLLVVLLVSGLVLSACTNTGFSASDTKGIARRNNEFALDLYQELKTLDGNLFFSPYSISSALAMTYAGAKGQTAARMSEVMRFLPDRQENDSAFLEITRSINAIGEKGYCQLHVANALWGQKGYDFLDSYVHLVQDYYHAGIYEVDFINATEKARQKINSWVEEKTRDKIKELIKKGVLNSATTLVLTNAIYFKGKWQEQFKEEDTRDMLFTTADGIQVKTPMMVQTTDFLYAQEGKVQILQMPYEGDDISMVIFLPARSYGIERLEEVFNIDNVQKWLSKLKEREVVVYFPRFKMTSEFSLKEYLVRMGMQEAFSPRADFSGMTGNRDFFISDVIHKAFVEVNEEGTEAAAATAVIMKGCAFESEPAVVFKADHPFIFIIRDTRSGSILFCGRVMDPQA